MQFISNHKRPAHLSLVNRLLSNADEIIICVAFLKNSGLDLISKKISANCTFYIGTDFYLTEPTAIKKIIQQGHKVYLTKKTKTTFHPKMYYFRNGNKISILTGSANLTGGGLESNIELSLFIETNKISRIANDFKSIIEYYKSNSVQIINDLQISQYEREFDIYRKKHRKADREFKEEIDNVHKIDLPYLEKYFKKYIKEVGCEKFEKRIKDYKTIKKLLDNLTKQNIRSATDFLSYYDVIANSFYSSDLLRGKSIFSKKYKSIIAVIKFIQNNKAQSPKYVYGKARQLIQPINKFGVNALTEIMNTYNPTEFSVANMRILKSLSNLGFAEFPVTNKKVFDSEIYDRYNNLIKEIALICKAKDLGEVDHFLSWYYTNYVDLKNKK